MKSSDAMMTVMYLALGLFALWALSRIPPGAIEHFLRTLAVIVVLVVVFVLLGSIFQHQYPGR